METESSTGYNDNATLNWIHNGGGTDKSPAMSILHGGNVGIGTDNPTDQLHVRTTDTTGDIRIGGGNGANNHRVYIHAHPTAAYIDSYGGGAHNSLGIQASVLHLNSVSGGNVGIGTNAPGSYKLKVAGTLGVTGAATFTPSSGENVVIARDSAGPYIGTSTNQSLRIITNSGSAISIATNKKIAIGSAIDGTAPLHLKYASGSYGAENTSGFISHATSGRGTIRIRSDADAAAELFYDVNGAIRFDVSVRQSSESYNMHWYNQAASPSLTAVAGPVMTLTQTGRLGIGTGTTSPGSTLDLRTANTGSGSDFGTKAIIARMPLVSGYTGAIVSGLGFYDSTIHSTDIGYAYNRNSTGGYDLIFSTNNDTTGNPVERMTINADGLVGIGTTAPAATLHLRASYPTLTLETSANANDPLITLKSSGGISGEGAQIYYNNSVGSLHITTTYENTAAAIKFHTATGADRATNNVRMIIDGAGKVGIGTATLDTNNKLTLYHGDDNSYAALALQSDHTSTGNGNGSWLGIDNNSDMGLYVWNYEAAPLRFGTSATERMRIDINGTVRMTKGGTAFTPLLYDGLVIQNSDATGIRLIDAGNGGGNGGHCGIGNDNGHLVMSTAGAMHFDNGFEATDQLYAGRHTKMIIDASGNVGIGTGNTGVANPDVTSVGVSLEVTGPIMSGKAQGFSVNAQATRAQNIKDWFVFCGPGTNSSGNYVHMKTNLNNSTANNAYTMSCFNYHSYYAYGGNTTTGGYIGWHNWSGNYYNVQKVNNGASLALVQSSYVSSDNNVVLVALVGAGYAQFSIDWHQWAGYPFRTAKVTAVSMTSSATGAY
jgi:hypothetical protein